MTITVTVQELRAYQQEMEQWAKQRSAVFEEVATSLADKHRDLVAIERLSKRDATLGEHLPMPTLIPKA